MSAIPTDTVERTNATRHEPIGRLLVQAGALTVEQVEQVVFAQRKAGLLFGEAAQSLGLINARQVQDALLLQYSAFGIPGAGSGLDPSLIVALDPGCKVAESIRDLRSQLSLRWFNKNQKSLAVAGVNVADGCSTIAANLAIAFAQLGERVMLIDANLRRPRQHALFGVRNSVGLSSVLAGRESITGGVIQIPSLPGLSLMPTGPIPPNPQELLASAMFDYVLDKLPYVCDVMIIDSSAHLASSDAQLVAAKVGGCLLAIRRHHTSLADVTRVAERLAPANVKMLGAVLND